eukprot:jgi/Chrzof1/13873/Cz08g15230.t1
MTVLVGACTNLASSAVNLCWGSVQAGQEQGYVNNRDILLYDYIFNYTQHSVQRFSSSTSQSSSRPNTAACFYFLLQAIHSQLRTLPRQRSPPTSIVQGVLVSSLTTFVDVTTLAGQYQVACTDFQYGASQQWTGPSLCLMFVLTRMLSSRTAVLCALYGVGGDLSFLHCCFACCVAHTQPHSVCPVPSVELPCLCTYNYNTRCTSQG